MKPSVKSQAVEDAFGDMFGFDRREGIYNNHCAPKPIGCGRDIHPDLDFRDALSAKEFTISGLCQSCQDSVFGSDGAPKDAEGQWAEPPIAADEYECGRGPMVSAQGEAVSKVYTAHLDKRGCTWFVAANVPNPGDYVYVTNPQNRKGEGFGGATLKMPLVDGSTFEMHGGWHGNSDSLFTATGIDIRDKHLTHVVLGTGKRHISRVAFGIVTGVFYREDEWQVGLFKRGDALARAAANERGEIVFYAIQSCGGGSYGSVKPEAVQ